MPDVHDPRVPGVQDRLSPEDFRNVIGHFASGVTIITLAHEGVSYGTTASALCSLSLDPPMILVCMNGASSTGQAMSRAGGFAVNILAVDQGGLARRFATKDPDKFQGVAAEAGAHGHPLLVDAVAHLECVTAEEVAGATHTVFLANVVGASAHGGTPLAYFRGRFGRLDLEDHEAAYAALRDSVLESEETRGRALDTAAAGEELGIGPAPLAHALGRLEAEGVLHRLADGTHVVTPITFENLRGIMDARAAIELGVVDLVAGNVDPGRLASLRDIAQETVGLVDRSRFVDAERFSAANEDFHRALVGLAGSEALVDAYRRLDAAGMIAAVQGRIPEESAVEGLADIHLAIVGRLESGDREGARAALRVHADRALEMVRRALAAPPKGRDDAPRPG